MAYSYQAAIQGSSGVGSSSSGIIQFFNPPSISSAFGGGGVGVGVGEDTTYTKVFVGGLAWETQSHTLRRYFEQFGGILEAVVIADKHTGRSKGYGFVRYTAYGPEYVYPQGVYNPYVGQQYLQIYGLPGTVNTGMYPYGQLRQPIPGGQGYSALQGFAMPGHHIMQAGRPNVSGTTTTTFSAVQAPYPIGVAAPNRGQPQIMLCAPSPQITQSSGSDQTVG